MTSKQFVTELARGLGRTFAMFKWKALKIFGGFSTSLLESTSDAHRKIANCVAILTNRLTSARGDCTVRPFSSASDTSAAAARRQK